MNNYYVLLKDLKSRFPINWKQLLDFSSHVCDNFDYGAWMVGYDDPKKTSRRINSVKSYHKTGHYKKLSKSRIMKHLLSNDNKDELLYFANSCWTIDNQRIIFAMLDFDNKNNKYTSDQMDELVSYVRTIHPCFSNMISQKSTGGSGRHAYPLFTFKYSDSITDTFEIAELLIELGDIIRKSIEDKFGKTSPEERPFDAIKGLPVRRLGKYEINNCGVLGKFVTVSNDTEAGLLLESVKEGFDLKETVKSLQTNTQNQEDKNLDRRRDRQEKHQHCGITAETALFSELDTFARASKSVVFFRQNNPTLSFEDYYHWYTDQGLDIGHSDSRCCKQAWEYNIGVFTPKPTGWTQEQSKSVIMSLALDSEALDYSIGSRYAKTSLTKVINTCTVMTNLLMKKNEKEFRQGTIESEYIKKTCQLNGAEWQHIKKLLFKYEVFSLVDNTYFVGGKENGRAKKYGFAIKHPEFN